MQEDRIKMDICLQFTDLFTEVISLQDFFLNTLLLFIKNINLKLEVHPPSNGIRTEKERMWSSFFTICSFGSQKNIIPQRTTKVWHEGHLGLILCGPQIWFNNDTKLAYPVHVIDADVDVQSVVRGHLWPSEWFCLASNHNSRHGFIIFSIPVLFLIFPP